jgi:hypothetical protein
MVLIALLCPAGAARPSIAAWMTKTQCACQKVAVRGEPRVTVHGTCLIEAGEVNRVTIA